MKKSCWYLNFLRKKYKYYILCYYTEFFKVYIYSNNKYVLSRYRYKKLKKYYFVTSVRSTLL